MPPQPVPQRQRQTNFTHKIERFNPLLIEHHHLNNACVVGEHRGYVAAYQGQWLGLATWSAPALHLKARDAFIGWVEEQRRVRLSLLANNAPRLILPESGTSDKFRTQAVLCVSDAA